MSHSKNKIWIHAVWSTKKRTSLINPQVEKRIYQFMKEQFQNQGCKVQIINGMPDHVHCLFLLSRKKSVAEVVKQVKGSTSYFINQNKIIAENFAWQTGYAAFSVSESIIDKVYFYIKNQKAHHLGQDFNEELNDLCRTNGYSAE